MTDAPPPLHSEWAGLAQIAAQLRDQRAGYFPAGDARVERMAIVAATWAAVVAGKPIDRQGADWSAIRADIEATATEAERRAADAKTPAARLRADAIAAIAWHFREYRSDGDTPMLVFCHDTTLALRARIAAERASTAPAITVGTRPRQRPATPAPASAVADCRQQSAGLFGQAA